MRLEEIADSPRLSWNLHVSPDDQALIDQAAAETLVEQTWLQVAPDRLTAFLESLDAPPQPNQRLRTALTAVAPWQA